MRKYVLLILAMMFMSSGIIGQRPGGGEGPPSGMVGRIQGRIFITEGEPLEYANVALYRQKDSSLITGTVTDEKGTFALEKVPFGKYYLELNFVGFRERRISDIEVNPENRNHDLGRLNLEETTENIESVEVTAQRPQVNYQVDKKVIDVDQDYSSQGQSAVEVLRNVPSIQVDIEGNVELRGSSNFRVLVDGKPSLLDGSDALQQIPASKIDDIEIITNPSAKYDPEGTAGIINVLMKEGRRPGLNGMIDASAGTNEAYNASANLNYRLSDKFNLITSLNYRDFNFDMEGVSERTNFGDTTTYINQNMDNTMGRDGYSFEAGIEYSMTESSSLTLSGRAGTFGFGGGGETQIHTYTNPGSASNYEITSTDNDMSDDYYRVDLDYQNKFDEDGHQLDASMYYSGSDHENTDTRKEFRADSDWDRISDDPFMQRTRETSTEDELRVKLDYTKPFSNGSKLEAGYQGRYNQNDQHYVLQNYQNTQWVTDSDFTNDADYSRWIQALYATYSGNLIGIEYQLGLRGEYTDRLLEQQTLNESYGVNRFNIFPSVHLTKRFSREEQLFASYSKRIQRPRRWFIDPFKSYRDQYSVQMGNPALEPEYTDSYELGYKKTFGKSFATLETYHRRTHNGITRIQERGEGNIMIQTFDNISQEFSTGVGLSVNTSLYKWWNLNLSGSFYEYSLEGEVIGENISRRSNNWSARFNSNFTLPTGTRLQLMARYNGPSVTAQGEREGFLMTNMGLRHSFLNDKLTLNVSGRDLLQSMNREMTSSGPGFETYRFMERESPIINFSVSYTINNYERQRQEEEAPVESQDRQQQMF
ncbi:MAG: TonB-dependent receptor family protein [Bacteroidales bacterium]|nr:TonB-dependent receptor family protein [Bacteroidales bacterium]